MTRRSLADLVAATPPDRDRYVDFLRAASILVVMFGHWTMAVVERRDGAWRTTNLLAEVPGLWPLTWLLQVMPVFFFVGGFSNLVTLDSMARRGAGYAEFAASRSWRLLKPVLVLLAIWLPLVSLAQETQLLTRDDLRVVSGAVSQPLWFIGIYLIVTALAPPMRRLHRAFGVAVPVALIAAAAAVDVIRFTQGAAAIGYLNFGFVWLYAQQLGFFYADGSLTRASRLTFLIGAVAGVAALWGLTSPGPYPRSMVGLPGEAISNMNPPTVCLVALATWQVGLLMLLRDAGRRLLERAGLWAAVILGNSVIMTLFLWHLTALLIVAVIAIPGGFPQPAVGSGAWWLARIPWFVMLAVVTTGLVTLFGRLERPGAGATCRGSGSTVWLASVAIALLIAGICGFAVSGLHDFAVPAGRALLGVPVSPLIDASALLAGAVLFRLSRTGVWEGR